MMQHPTGRFIKLTAKQRFGGLVERLFCSSSVHDEKLRIAIVGGGVAGLSSALHLAELVERGHVQKIDVYTMPPQARDIGVGVWSTALTPFQQSWRSSHQLVWDEWMHAGRWLNHVGYRSPSGTWLAKSTLPTEGSFADFPGLLFLRESDLLHSLQKAVHLEEMTAGTIQIHSNVKVKGIAEGNSSLKWSAPLELEDGSITEYYHLIIGAEGMRSNLRERYGGYSSSRTRLTGTNVFNASDDSSSQSQRWKQVGQAEANSIEDRNYSVLRGNAPLTNDEIGLNGISFQTWGEGKSMRFATVPLSYPSDTGRVENQVWFATTSDENIIHEQDAEKRKEKLLISFSSWHSPITRMMEATPANEILSEPALAHKHTVGPVLDVHGVLRQLHGNSIPSAGPGPVIVFIGDSYMTVDPILAQGFTMALEGANELSTPIEGACTIDAGFDPIALRKNLQDRHDRRYHRLVALLRATELVQALGQPQASLGGLVAKNVIRPAMQLTPNFVKAPIFNSMLKYSLGK